MTSIKKILGVTALCLATGYGTFRNTAGLIPWNTCVEKDNFGICTSLATGVDKQASFYGLVVSGVGVNLGEINGLHASLGNLSIGNSQINGLELAVGNGILEKSITPQITPNCVVNGAQLALGFNEATNVNGLQLGCLFNIARKSLNGAQFGIANFAERVRGVQLGIYNQTEAGSNHGYQAGLVNNYRDAQGINHVSIGINILGGN